MDTILSDLDFAVVYLDDKLKNSQNEEENKKHVFKVSSRIHEYGFKLKEFKCDLFMEKNKYLGLIIDKNDRQREANSCKRLFVAKFLRTDKLLPSVYT